MGSVDASVIVSVMAVVSAVSTPAETWANSGVYVNSGGSQGKAGACSVVWKPVSHRVRVAGSSVIDVATGMPVIVTVLDQREVRRGQAV